MASGNSKKFWVTGISILLLALLASGYFFYWKRRIPAAAPADFAAYRSRVTYQIFYPDPTNKKYKVDRRTIGLASGILAYAVRLPDGKTATVSIQSPIPKDALAFLYAVNPYSSRAGDLFAFEEGPSVRAVITNEKATIYINTSEVSKQEISSLADNLVGQ